MPKTTVTSLRATNLSRALHSLHAARQLTRAQLTAELGVARNTAAQVVANLVDFGLLEETPAGSSGRRGRPTYDLRFGPLSPVAVIAEISPQEIRVATAHLGRTVTDLDVMPHKDDAPEAVLARLAKALPLRVDALGTRCVGVGVALYGLTDAEGRVEIAPNLGWRGVPLLAELSRTLPAGLPIHLENDASAAAVYEARYGAGSGAQIVLYLYSAAGVGGGLTVDGQLIAGRHGYTGEVGHMLINPVGRLCRCGRTGCWETEADQRALRRRGAVSRALDDEAAAAEVLVAAARGGTRATAAVVETARWFGEGLGSLLNVFDPDRVVVAGLFADLLGAVRDLVLDTADQRRLAHGEELASLVVPSRFGREASLLGTADRVLQTVLDDPGRGRFPA